ncbi:MAG: lysozyme, partial [Rothia dentocariosa]
ILRADLKPTEAAVNSAVTREITQKQYDALVSFTFNLGAGTFKSSDVLEFTNQGNYQAAADALLQYSHAGGEFIPGLYKRGRRKGLCIFLRFPKDKIQCGTTSGVSYHDGFFRKSFKVSESVETLTGYSE